MKMMQFSDSTEEKSRVMWVFYPKESTDKLLNSKSRRIDVTNKVPYNMPYQLAYKYIVDLYSNKFTCNPFGLIWGHMGSSMYPMLTDKADLFKVIESMGAPSPVWFPKSTHDLLVLDIPKDIPILEVDYKREIDLTAAFYSADSDTVEKAKKELLHPYHLDGSWGMKIGYIPYISTDWMLEYFRSW